MSNSYFNFTTGRMVAGENALAEDVNAGFDAVAAGFDKLPTPDATKFLAGAHNTTSGSAGNFVLAVTADSYFDGMAVSFKANHSNSGACTLNVGSLGAKSLVDGNGSALAVGDIVANSIYAARYNSTSDKFHLVGLSSGNAADAAVIAANIADVATIADNIDELLLVDDNATAAAGSASDASGYADDALTQAGLASDYADAAAASAANLPNATTAGADKILTTNAAGDGWAYVDKVALGRKNLLINGGFDVWQDGTSFSGISTTPVYVADGWYVYNPVYNPLALVVTRQSLINNKFCMRCAMTANGAVGGFVLVQRIEGLEKFLGRTVTVAFDARVVTGGSAGHVVNVRLNREFNTDSPPAMPNVVNVSSGSGYIAPTTSFVRYFFTFDIPTTILSSWGTSSALELMINLQDSSAQNVTYEFSEVQLEFGDTATDFEYRHPGEELALCQRYYEKGTLRGPFAQYTTNFAVGPQGSFLVEKRKTPLVTLGALSTTGSDGTPGALYSANNNTRGINPVYNWTGGTGGRSFFGQVTWTADARL